MKPATFIIILLICMLNGALSAQPYNNAVGVRAGFSTGLIYRHFLDDEQAIEALAMYNKFGFQATGLYEFQFNPYPKQRLQYMTGAGIFSGNWDSEFSAGATLMAGAEYIFRDVPLSIGLDWKPMMNFYRNFGYTLLDFGLTVRVVLNK